MHNLLLLLYLKFHVQFVKVVLQSFFNLILSIEKSIILIFYTSYIIHVPFFFFFSSEGSYIYLSLSLFVSNFFYKLLYAICLTHYFLCFFLCQIICRKFSSFLIFCQHFKCVGFSLIAFRMSPLHNQLSLACKRHAFDSP